MLVFGRGKPGFKSRLTHIFWTVRKKSSERRRCGPKSVLELSKPLQRERTWCTRCTLHYQKRSIGKTRQLDTWKRGDDSPPAGRVPVTPTKPFSCLATKKTTSKKGGVTWVPPSKRVGSPQRHVEDKTLFQQHFLAESVLSLNHSCCGRLYQSG